MTRRLLNNFFSCHSKIDILRTIVNSERPLSGRQIATRAGLSPRSCQLSLDDLVRLNALKRNIAGKAYYYHVNLNNQIVTDLIVPIIQQEERLTQKIVEELRVKFGRKQNGTRGLYFLEQWPDRWGGKEDSVRLMAVLKNGAPPKSLQSRLDQACEHMHDNYGLPAGSLIMHPQDISELVNSQPEELKTVKQRLRNISGLAFLDLVLDLKKRPEHLQQSVDFFQSRKRRTVSNQ